VAGEERRVEGLPRLRPEAFVVTGGGHGERTRALLGRARIPVVETWGLLARPLGHVGDPRTRRAGG